MKKPILIASLAMVSACSLRPATLESVVSIVFSPPQERAVLDWRAFLSETDARALLSSYTPPLYACVGVNVVGPGIPNSGHGEDDPAAVLATLRTETTSCTYKGAMSGFVSTSASGSAEVSVNVPVGPDRIIQVAGASPSAGTCEFSLEGGTGIYEWGRAYSGIFGPMTLNITGHGDATAGLALRKMNCGGGGSIGSMEGKILWYSADDLCNGITDGTIAPTVWNSLISAGVAMTRQGSVTCESGVNGHRAARSDAAIEKFSGSFPAADPLTNNLEGLTAFVVGKYTGTSASYTASLSMYAGSSQFAIQHWYMPGPPIHEIDQLSVQMGIPILTNNAASLVTHSLPRVFGARAKEGVGTRFRVKGSADYIDQSPTGALTRFNDVGAVMTFDIGSSMTASESIEVYEVLVFNRALSDQEFDNVFWQLRDKYGIAP